MTIIKELKNASYVIAKDGDQDFLTVVDLVDAIAIVNRFDALLAGNERQFLISLVEQEMKQYQLLIDCEGDNSIKEKLKLSRLKQEVLLDKLSK